MEIRVTRGRTLMHATAGEIESAREWFRAHGYLKLRGFIEPHLLASLLDGLDHTPFRNRVHEGIGTELCAEEGPVSSTLEFLMNDPAMTAAISSVTKCGAIGCFEGRVYRLVPQTDHYDSWHSDVGQDRLIAMSINLGRRPYEGGVLQFRRADDARILGEVENRTTGDAVIFKVDPALRHRVCAVEGTEPRTAYAGWYRAAPDFRTLLRTRVRG